MNFKDIVYTKYGSNRDMLLRKIKYEVEKNIDAIKYSFRNRNEQKDERYAS